MGLPVSVVVTGCDSVGVLHHALHAAYTFRPMSPSATRALLARTAGAAARGRYEKYKTSEIFDMTAKHPPWLDSAET